MDILNYFISKHNKNTLKFSEIFNSIHELKLILNDKSYVLNHYLSMFFRLIKQMDFTYLQEKIHCLFEKSVEKFSWPSKKFHYQKPETNKNLLILSVTNFIIEQALSDFTTEIYYYCCKEIDVIEFQETENQTFLQVKIKELGLTLTIHDIETDNEIFRLFLKNL